ncbi:probable 4-coumarate--CoA ligase 3 [Folsomia candida]|uniref:probable 4-coumarate--CoA ligase 3 n=1 Tax=Folsomia candida TaxID=158441 RepID=UPI001604DA16|nr:probable 4-coumarate--CoA ligase 3 [Folsomia candida]
MTILIDDDSSSPTNPDSDSSKTLRSPCPLKSSGKGKTLPEVFLERRGKNSDPAEPEFCMRDSITKESYRFADFDDQTARIASAFYKKGMRKGDVVVYITNDMVKLPLFLVGVWRGNGIARAVYPEEDLETLHAALEESRVGWIYCGPETAVMALCAASKVYWDVEVILTNGMADGCTDFGEFLLDDGSQVPELNISPTDPALMLCTSGTTGRSKSAVHTHESILSILLAMENIPWSTTGENPNLILSKTCHITGTLWPLSIILKGGCCIVMDRATVERIMDAVDEYKPRVIWGFPTLLLQVANSPNEENRDLTSLELSLSAGSPITPPMIQAIKKLPNMKGIINLYGLTECVPVTCCIDFENVMENGDSDDNSSASCLFEDQPEFTVGKVFPGVEVQVRDPETGEILGVREQGEICAKTESTFLEYFENPKATREAFIDGYFRTGDIGYYDENGFIMVVDRLKEIFKFIGNHVSPTEIEDVISRHPAVAMVSVVGMPDPEGRGHVPRAFVVKRTGYEDTTGEEIRTFADNNLADYKRLRGGLYTVDALPQGKTGKVTRSLVQQIVVDQNNEEVDVET